MNEEQAILVTGGAGYIGSHTVHLLATQGRKIVVLDNLVYGHKNAIIDDGVELVVGEIDDEKLLAELFQRYSFSAVVHFAAYAYVGESVQDPLKYYQNNTANPLTLLRVMQEHDCKVFVFSSTCATYGEPEEVPIVETCRQEPINPYGRSKLMLEWILRDCGRAWGLRSACLRYFNASGAAEDGLLGEDHDPETHLIPLVLMAITGEIPRITVFGTDYPTPDGTCIRDYIHVSDLADAHGRALDYLLQKGESFACNLGTGIGISVKEIIQAAETVTGKQVPTVYGDRRAGDPPVLLANPTRAKEILGWEAQRKDVEDIVETAWKWLTGPQKGRFLE